MTHVMKVAVFCNGESSYSAVYPLCSAAKPAYPPALSNPLSELFEINKQLIPPEYQDYFE